MRPKSDTPEKCLSNTIIVSHKYKVTNRLSRAILREKRQEIINVNQFTDIKSQCVQRVYLSAPG